MNQNLIFTAGVAQNITSDCGRRGHAPPFVIPLTAFGFGVPALHATPVFISGYSAAVGAYIRLSVCIMQSSWVIN